MKTFLGYILELIKKSCSVIDALNAYALHFFSYSLVTCVLWSCEARVHENVCVNIFSHCSISSNFNYAG